MNSLVSHQEPNVTIRNVLIALTSAAAIAGAAGCGTSSTSIATTSSPASTATASSGQPSPAASAPSACANLGGKLDPDASCHLHTATPTYTLDFRFPVDYPDQQALTDSLTQERDDFVDWVGQPSPAAGAQSACADLGGTVDPDQTCHVHSATSNYTLDFSFPVSYPDQQQGLRIKPTDVVP
jgi:hypothetical protein